jgi:hypothetical protein
MDQVLIRDERRVQTQHGLGAQPLRQPVRKPPAVNWSPSLALSLDCPVECRQRFLDRRPDHIGDRQIAIVREDVGDVGEGFAQLIELLGGIGSILLVRGETKLGLWRSR